MVDGEWWMVNGERIAMNCQLSTINYLSVVEFE